MSRYIDAKKLIESLRKNCDGCKERGTDYCSTCWCSIAQLLEMIGNAPSAEVVERKKGKWIYRTEITCSVCGSSTTFDDNFCSRCGADMRGDGNDN